MLTQLSPSIPAIQGQQNSRLATYSASISPREIVQYVLKYDVRLSKIKNAPKLVRELMDELQRGAAKKDRIDAHINYILSREQMKHIWGYPAIAIVVEEAPKVRPAIPGDSDSPFVNVILSNTGFRIISDGVGREGGLIEFEDLIENDKFTDKAAKEIAKRVMAKMTLPVVIFAPADGQPPITREEAAQLFSDFNFKVRQVSSAKAMQTDSSDVYLQLARAIGNISVIHNNGGFVQGKAAVGKNMDAFVTEQMLYRMVRGACEGESAQETNAIDVDGANLTPATYQREFTQIEDFFSDLATAMGAKWLDKTGIHRTAPGWQALGVICNDVNHGKLALSSAQRARVFSSLGNLDWSRTNEQWVTDAKIGEFPPSDPANATATPPDPVKPLVFHKAGRTTRHNLIQFLRRITGLQEQIEFRDKPAAA